MDATLPINTFGSISVNSLTKVPCDLGKGNQLVDLWMIKKVYNLKNVIDTCTYIEKGTDLS